MIGWKSTIRKAFCVSNYTVHELSSPIIFGRDIDINVLNLATRGWVTSDKGRRKIARGAEIEEALSEWRRKDRFSRWASRLSLKVCQYTGGQLLLLRHYQRLRLRHYIYSVGPAGDTRQPGDVLKVQDIFFQFSRYGTQLDVSFFFSLIIFFFSCLRKRRRSRRARRAKEPPAVVVGRITRVIPLPLPPRRDGDTLRLR